MSDKQWIYRKEAKGILIHSLYMSSGYMSPGHKPKRYWPGKFLSHCTLDKDSEHWEYIADCITHEVLISIGFEAPSPLLHNLDRPYSRKANGDPDILSIALGIELIAIYHDLWGDGELGIPREEVPLHLHEGVRTPERVMQLECAVHRAVMHEERRHLHYRMDMTKGRAGHIYAVCPYNPIRDGIPIHKYHYQGLQAI